MPVLNVAGVVKRFGARTAVDAVDLQVAPGEVVGLLGPNGAGKTTLVSLIAGLRAPDAGRVTIDGADPATDRAARRRLGLCPQELSLYPELNCDQNLAFFGALYGLRGAALRARADAVLDRVQLADRRTEPVAVFSGGMKRRLNLAIAMLHEPSVLLLDEPTVGVDPQSRSHLFDEVERLRDQGCALLYTTHYMEEAERLCDRIYVIDAGKIIADGTLDAILTDGGDGRAVTLRFPQGAPPPDPAAIAAALHAAGYADSADPVQVDLERRTLESIFLGLTGRSLRD